MIELVKNPVREIDGNKINVIAGFSQIPYTFQRKDYEVDYASSSTNILEIYLTPGSGDLTNIIFSKDVIYFSGIDENTYIESMDYDSVNDRMVLTTGYLYSGSQLQGGYINNITQRADYKVMIEPVNYLTGKSKLKTPLVYKVDYSGKLFADLKNIIAKDISPLETEQIYIKYYEYYQGTTQNEYTDEVIIPLPSKKSLLQEGGSTMWENILLTSTELLTDYENHLIKPSIKKTLWSIIDTYFSARFPGADISFNQEYLDVNKNPLPLGQLDFYESAFNPFQFYNSEPVELLHYEISDTIQNNVGLIPLVLEYPEILNPFYIKPKILINGNNALKDYFVKVEKSCRNQFILEWLNGKGVMENWVFEINQRVRMNTSEGRIFEKPIISEIDEVSDTLGRISIDSTTEVLIWAEKLKKDQLLALEQIKRSPLVYYWLNPSGTEKIRVIVSGEFTTDYENDSALNEIALQIRFPRGYDYT